MKTKQILMLLPIFISFCGCTHPKPDSQPQKKIPMPSKQIMENAVVVVLNMVFSAEEARRIYHGYQSESQDFKWNLVYADGFICFERVVTGRCEYLVELQPQPSGEVVAKRAWIRRLDGAIYKMDIEIIECNLRALANGSLGYSNNSRVNSAASQKGSD